MKDKEVIELIKESKEKNLKKLEVELIERRSDKERLIGVTSESIDRNILIINKQNRILQSK